MQNRFPLIAVSLLALAALTACGGGGGGSTAETTAPIVTPTPTPTPIPAPTAPAQLSGKVIDGYVEGATVCLDLNQDGECSVGEPASISKADGSYTLAMNGLTIEQIRASSVLAVLPLTAKDADDAGKTFAQAGRSVFNMSTPAVQFVTKTGVASSVVVSPLTTLVHEEMKSNPASTVVDAEALIKSKLNLAIVQNPFADFIANPDAALHEKARVMARTFGEAARILKAKNPALSEKSANTQAIQFARDNALKLVADVQFNLAASFSINDALSKALAANGLSMPVTPAPNPAPTDVVPGACPDKFTVAQFDAIKGGMSKKDIDAVVGCTGVLAAGSLTYSNGRSDVDTSLNKIMVIMNGDTYMGNFSPKQSIVILGVVHGFTENQKVFYGPIN